jgi:hypothetical protein
MEGPAVTAMPDLAEILQAGVAGDSPAWPDFGRMHRRAYEAWLEEIRRAKVIANSPATPNASRPQDRGVPPAHWFPGDGIGDGDPY